MKRILIKIALICFFSILFFGQSMRVEAANFKEPFAMLLMGIDTGDKGRTDRGRSDVLMVATVNPSTEKVVVTSIPRDAYVDIPGHGMDKINHAYAFGGADLSRETVQSWLGIEIPYHVCVDMKGLADIVDAVGGVDVVPPSSFDIGGYSFVEGQQTHVNGDQALAYARERYTSGGDYARQERQRQILLGIVNSGLANASGIKDVLSMATQIEHYLDTNLSLVDLGSLALEHRDLNPQIDFNQFQGEGTEIDGIYYDQITEESLQENLKIIKSELEVGPDNIENKEQTINKPA
ncbi:LCP family protein [Facklamia lactis]|nr:LCP family protein [Facklamia lactis]